MTLVLRYAPGKKVFSVQRINPDDTREILAQIPTSDRKDFVTIEGLHYAITPQMYQSAWLFRNTYLTLPVSSAKVAQAKTVKAVKKPLSKLASTWAAVTSFFKGAMA